MIGPRFSQWVEVCFPKSWGQWKLSSINKSLFWNNNDPILGSLGQLQQIVDPDVIFTFNSLGPSDAIWRWRSWSTLVQVMACCLTAPSHYLNQCWFIISKGLWHSSEDIIIRRFEVTNQWSKIEVCIFKITSRSPRGQWVNGCSKKFFILQNNMLDPSNHIHIWTPVRCEMACYLFGMEP